VGGAGGGQRGGGIWFRAGGRGGREQGGLLSGLWKGWYGRGLHTFGGAGGPGGAEWGRSHLFHPKLKWGEGTDGLAGACGSDKLRAKCYYG